MNDTFRNALVQAAADGYIDRPQRTFRPVAVAAKAPTDKMIQLIFDLATEQGTALPTDDQVASWDFDKARQIIGWYLDRSEKLGLNNRYGKYKGVAIPEGRYAVKTVDFENPTNTINFYRVECETEGKWAGTLYVRHIVSEIEFVVKGESRKVVLAAIAHDVEAALRLYGTENRRCGYCNRNLTNDDSRAYGIGPVCRGKLGF